MEKRIYKEFTEEQLEIIKQSQKKCSLTDLAKLLEINYSNLTGALKQQKILFEPIIRKNSFKKEACSMDKEKNEYGELLVTDALMSDWFDMI